MLRMLTSTSAFTKETMYCQEGQWIGLLHTKAASTLTQQCIRCMGCHGTSFWCCLQRCNTCQGIKFNSDCCCRAKKSLVTDFAIFAVDFSNPDMTTFLRLASTIQVSMGNSIATTSAAYFVIAPKETPTADAYADVSESFFLDANQNGKLVKLGLSTSSSQLPPTSFLLVIEYDYFTNGVLMGSGYLIYSPATLAVEKNGLPTAKSIINTLD